eukprot:365212-Chlamydomonas_euryale.AAC.1
MAGLQSAGMCACAHGLAALLACLLPGCVHGMVSTLASRLPPRPVPSPVPSPAPFIAHPCFSSLGRSYNLFQQGSVDHLPPPSPARGGHLSPASHPTPPSDTPHLTPPFAERCLHRDPADPTKFFQQGNQNQQDMINFAMIMIALYAVYQGFSSVITL